MLSWLTSEGVSLLLGAVARFLLDAWNDYQARQAQRALGAAETAATTNKETADARQRAAQAQINAPGVDGTVDDMERGKF